ncbi:hypothetical protein TD95_001041 [Thielaviopsis punctulata]|uniref:Poly(A) polymerase n=1 Tax=Thielaviopsis punctulata TaxID=72032 RepID=A0A0F4ZJR5_9PEZI|nr:hypothetical protein TD95_001041 [Thielaviopsis punctulata]
MPPADQPQQLGVTPPISTSLPTEEENRANTALLEELRAQGTFESPADTEKRHKVLASLQQICDEFVRRVAAKRHPNKDALIKAARGKVFTYGSFRLGVYGPGSDIDTLVVAPKYVTREDYFEIFPDLLLEMAPPGAITDMAVVQDAFVPIIKFEYHDISIDLIFSRIAVLQQLPSEPDFDLKDSNLLRGLDDKELRSLNGTRVTDQILSLVPEKTTFRLALRAIKLWAQRRAVYANIMGFPGGVAWAMLVARVCQLYPKATSSTIVGKFFNLLSQWPWPQPVLLKKVESGPLQVRVWNPQLYKADNFHLMPIITPAYPSMCATYNITASTKSIIVRELMHGHEVARQILDGQKPWSELFVKHSFFTSGYKYYLAIVSSSTTKEAHKKWSGLVESKVRVMVQNLDRHESIKVAHPFVKGFERVHECESEEQIRKVQEGSLEFVIRDNKSPSDQEKHEEDEKESNGGKEKTKVYTLTHYIGMELQTDAKSLDLSYEVAEFKDLCVKWDKYEPDLNFLTIQHVRNFDLPDDVFDAGEAKPKRKMVKRSRNKPAEGSTADASASAATPASTAAEAQNKKRRTTADEAQPTAKRLQQTFVAAS